MRSLLALVLLPALASAQPLVPVLLESAGVSEASLKKLKAAADAQLKAVAGVPVGAWAAPKKGAPTRCDEACAAEAARATGAALALVLDFHALEGKGDKVSLDATLFLDGKAFPTRHGEGAAEAFEGWGRGLLDGALPGWARKGFGGLRVEAGAGAVVKVDSRVTPVKSGEALALTAGAHQVDVVFPSGSALLQRVDVAEGARARLEVTAPEITTAATSPRQAGALRAAAYATWMAGAAALAGGLLSGALSRNTAAGLTPCSASSRTCETLDVVLARQRQSQSLADTGNVLLGVGAGLAVVGAGLFAVDVVTP